MLDNTIFKFLIIFISFLFFSCHNNFNNPVDPKADDYIGYEVVLEENKVINVSPKNGEKIKYPALLWTEALGDATYAVQISQYNHFDIYPNIYTNENLKENWLALYTYDSKKPWDTVNQEPLWSLPAGNYWWRTNIKSEATLNSWGDWCNATNFEQELRLTQMYWKNDESAVKQGYIYYYDLYGKAEKKVSFIKFSSEENYRFLESTISVYSENRQIETERLFSADNCEPNTITSLKKFYYELGYDNRIEIKEKKLLQTDNTILEIEQLIEINYYTYIDDTSKIIKSIKKMKINEDNEEILYYISEYEDGLQKKTTFYRDGEITYYYDLFFLKEYPKKPYLAIYYMKNSDTDEMEYYNDYILEYNYPSKSNENSVTIGIGRGILENKKGMQDGTELSPPIFN